MTKLKEIFSKKEEEKKNEAVKAPFVFSFEFDVVQYPNKVIGKKSIEVQAESEDKALDQAAEILNSELKDDQHLRYTQKFTKKDNV